MTVKGIFARKIQFLHATTQMVKYDICDYYGYLGFIVVGIFQQFNPKCNNWHDKSCEVN